MLEIYDQTHQHVPIKAWVGSKEDLEHGCLHQAKNLSMLNFVHKWVALMPDTHQGYGMPIGGVAALIDHVIPNAVGVDIGCGMVFTHTNIPLSELTDEKSELLISRIMKEIPLGFERHNEKQTSLALQEYLDESDYDFSRIGHLFKEIEASWYQIGTLGGGNHFIEIQADENDELGIMIHSGSRNFGFKIANYFNDKAKIYAKKHGGSLAAKHQLAYLPVDSVSGQDYLNWMKLALRFARENRRIMMEKVQAIVSEVFTNVSFEETINAHHNYASLETHYGKEVWVHRKGAIRADEGMMGIIPGAMGNPSYIIRGLGCAESFNSCSHGAGRHMSRKAAMKAFKKDDVIKDLAEKGIHVGAPKQSILTDESRFAYKDIAEVMKQQTDLAEIVKSLRTRLVVKG